jgi:hypothetical protein
MNGREGAFGRVKGGLEGGRGRIEGKKCGGKKKKKFSLIFFRPQVSRNKQAEFRTRILEFLKQKLSPKFQPKIEFLFHVLDEVQLGILSHVNQKITTQLFQKGFPPSDFVYPIFF